MSGFDPETIPIEFTGVRPGEKLEETLWERDAIVERTDNPDVFQVQEHDFQAHLDIQPILQDVTAAAEGGDIERLHLALALAVPSYRRDDPLPRLVP